MASQVVFDYVSCVLSMRLDITVYYGQFVLSTVITSQFKVDDFIFFTISHAYTWTFSLQICEL